MERAIKLKIVTLCAAAIILVTARIAFSQANYRVLHNFAGGPDDGATPLLGALIQSGSTLYGMSMAGGSYSNGTIFRINTDGTDFNLIHNFVSSSIDGSRPYGSLLQSGSMLYGMAGSENDPNNNGTIFRLGMDGSGFQVLHRFGGPPGDGKWPYDSLIQSGSSLYGMTVCGGSHDAGSIRGGTVFKINTDGTGYQILHNFTGGNDGSWAPGNLARAGSLICGMTYGGGSRGLGIIFRMYTDGTDYQRIHTFTGGSNDGGNTHGSMILSGPILYGTTSNGGSNGLGAIFRMYVDGSGFQLLHSFAGDGNDGAQPSGAAMILSGSILYGMTGGGGSSGNGTIFQMRTDGTDYQILHSFTGADGANPIGSLFVSDSTLYGMTVEGGSSNIGVIFAMDIPEPSTISLMTMCGIYLLCMKEKRVWKLISQKQGENHENTKTG